MHPMHSRITQTYLRVDPSRAPSHPGSGAAAWVSLRLSDAAVPSGSDARCGSGGAGCLVPPRLRLLAIGLVALTWALIVGQTSIAGGLAARVETPLPESAVPAAKDVGPTPLCPVARREKARHHGRLHVAPRFPRPRSEDLNDDETSGDPDDDDDDDTTDYVNGNDDTNAPMTAWVQEIFRYRSDLESEAGPTWTHTLSSAFPRLQRLRC